MTSYTVDMLRRGMSPAGGSLEVKIVPAGAPLGRLLHVSPSEPVMVAKRLRLADHETMAIETLHVRESLVPDLTAADLQEHSFYELLRNRYVTTISGGVQTIEPTVTDEEESEALGVPLHSPAFLFERVSRDSSGEVVEFVRSVYRGDRYRIVTDLSTQPEARDARSSRIPRMAAS
jgi:GntR family transcriptional regulator